MTNILIKNTTVKEINLALLRLQGADSNSGTTTNVTVRSSSSSSGGSSVNLSGVYSKILTNAKNIASNTSSISLINTKLTEDEKSIKANTTNITKNTNNIASNSSKIGSIIGILSTDLYTLSAGDTTLALKNNYTLTEQEVTVPYATAALNDSDGNAINDTYLKLTGGILTGDLTVNGNIYQNGSSYITHAEHLYSKDDLILTRDGATTGLSSGTYTGIEALLYDGTNNGYLVFDNSGTAMVGDEGSLVPLLARDTEANMSDGKLVYWDATNKILKTSTGTTTTYLPLAGGTMTGTISSMDIVPKLNATYNLGSSTNKYSSVYATSFIGNASTLTALLTLRTIQTNLASTSSATFNGTANITPGITGTLLIANGGTGATTLASLRHNILASTTNDDTDFGDDSLIVGSYTTSTLSNGSIYKRTALHLYNYIKSKTDSVYLKLSGGTLTGALTGTTATFTTINGALNGNATTLTTLLTLRTFSITDGTNTGTTTSFNGSANLTLHLPTTIVLTLSGNLTSATKATQDGNGSVISSTYLKLAGGTLTGLLTGTTATFTTVNAALNGNLTSLTSATYDNNNNIISSTYLPLTGGTLTGNLTLPHVYTQNCGYNVISGSYNYGLSAYAYLHVGTLSYSNNGSNIKFDVFFGGDSLLDKCNVNIYGWAQGTIKPGIKVTGARFASDYGILGVYYVLGSAWNSAIEIYVGFKQLRNSSYGYEINSEFNRNNSITFDGTLSSSLPSGLVSVLPFGYDAGPWEATNVDATSHGIVPQTDNTYSLGVTNYRYNAVNAIQLRGFAGNFGNSGTWCLGLHITTAVDGGVGYILLLPITGTTSSGTWPKCGFEGRIYINRGSPSALNISGWMDICAVRAYNGWTVWARYNNSEASYITAIRQVLYNGTYYVAILTNASFWSLTLEGCFFNNDNCTLTSIALSAIYSYTDLLIPQQYGTSGTAYLPLTGGTLSGQLTGTTATFTTVNAALNGNLSTASLPLGGYSITDCLLPYAGTEDISSSGSLTAFASGLKTFLGSQYLNSYWYNVISIRHRNGTGDGNAYGLLIYNNMTMERSLQYQQHIAGNWSSLKTILDSSNYTTYTSSYLPLTGGTLSGSLSGTTLQFDSVTTILHPTSFISGWTSLTAGTTYYVKLGSIVWDEGQCQTKFQFRMYGSNVVSSVDVILSDSDSNGNLNITCNTNQFALGYGIQCIGLTSSSGWNTAKDVYAVVIAYATSGYNFTTNVETNNSMSFIAPSPSSTAVTLPYLTSTANRGISNNNYITLPTFVGALNGNLTSATKATQDGNGSVISSTYLKLSGGTMSGTILSSLLVPKLTNTYDLGSSSAYYNNGYINALSLKSANIGTSVEGTLTIQYGYTAVRCVIPTSAPLSYRSGAIWIE